MSELLKLEDHIDDNYQWRFESDALKKEEVPALVFFTKGKNRVNALRRAKAIEEVIVDEIR